MEPLEDRAVPAQFTVNTFLDTIDVNPGDGVALDASGKTSLRAAVMEANALVGGDTIFLPAGTFTLTIAGTGEDGAQLGDLDVTDTTGVLEIRGPVPSGAAIIDGNGIDRVFDIHAGGYVYAYYLTVTGGVANEGGGFRNAGHLFLATKAVVSGNSATTRGGGVDSSQAGSRLTVSHAAFENNHAGDINSPTISGIGGAVAASGAVAISDTPFSGNTAGASGGAISIRGSGTLDRNTYIGNQAREGGAIDAFASVGAGVNLNDSTFERNFATRSTANGGPILVGGAVRNQGAMRISGSTFTGNEASGAGATGGAILNTGTLTVVNSTISGNFAGTSTNTSSSGGGIYSTGTLRLVHATIVQNVARASGPGGGLYSAFGASSTIRNTIVALNGQGPSNAPDIVGTFTSQGGNFIGRGVGSSGWIASDQVGTFTTGAIDPLIGPLQDNGGYTATHSLLPGSTAIDRGVANSSPENAPRDQRGLNRPAGSANDIGAFEVQGANQPPTVQDDEYSMDEDTILSVPAELGVLANDSDPDGHPLSTVLAEGPANGSIDLNEDGSFTYTPVENFSGFDSFTYTVFDGNGGSAYGTATIRVQSVNDAPQVEDDDFTTDEDTLLEVLAPGILINDSDTEGDPLTVEILTGPANGVLDPAGNGGFIYVPNANFNGTDTFTYRVYDGSAYSSAATVTLTVVPVNDAPTLEDASFGVAENTANGTAVGSVTGADVDGDVLEYAIIGGNTGGAFSINAATGVIRVANAAALDYETTPTFNLIVEVRDPHGDTGTATITINLSDVPESPQVAIDILPGKAINRLNPKGKGKIAVAILSSAGFDARTVDVSSLKFGRTGQESSLSVHPKHGPRYSLEDVNGDGRLDVVVEFEADAAGFRSGDTKGILTGKLLNGIAFSAEDDVII